MLGGRLTVKPVPPLASGPVRKFPKKKDYSHLSTARRLDLETEGRGSGSSKSNHGSELQPQLRGESSIELGGTRDKGFKKRF